jgi:hypothetical protein
LDITCQTDINIYATNTEELMKKLEKDHEAGRLGIGRSYCRSFRVIVDEVDCIPITGKSIICFS